jgi:endoglucanase
MRLRAALLTLALGASLGAGPVSAQQPDDQPRQSARAADNPLAGRPWGVYKGKGDQAWMPYVNATGKRKRLLAKIALRPKAKWYGAWIPDKDIEATVRKHIEATVGNDPETLWSASVFRMVPWEHEACDRLPTRAEQHSYKRWVRAFARGVGDTHAMLVLQPDGPFALCVPQDSPVPSRLVRFAARKLSRLPNASVYIDAGSFDWTSVSEALEILVPAGVEHARGFALNSTHYVGTGDEIRYAADVSDALAAMGITGKRAVINTAANGRPFYGYDYDGPNFDNAETCRSRADTSCVTLGIPPTADVANAAWGLTAEENELATAYVDGYVWVGRPWLYMQNDPFVMARALAVARTTPF